MTRALVIIRNAQDREKVCRWARNVEPGTRIEFKQTKRSVPQNDLMWALLTDLSKQLAWHGQMMPPGDWKLVMLDGLKREMRIVPNLDGTGFVNLGRSSSDLSKQEFADLIEIIQAFGAQHGVVFADDQERAA